MLEDGADPQVATYIMDVRLDGLLWVPDIELNHALITALVERWRPETHSFHLPHGEMTITLQDMEVITGVAVNSLPVVGITHMSSGGVLCFDLLGHRPQAKEPGANDNMAVLCGAKLEASWLTSQFSNPLLVNATDL